MKMRMKSLLTVCLLALILIFASGCAEEESHYDINNSENFNVSVKYDANGGSFTTNTSIIVDSFNISEMKSDSDGQVKIPLLAPDSEQRMDSFNGKMNKPNCFLAGWYAERTESTDADGNKSYTYSEKWDFETDRVSVDPKGTYSSSEPVLTLYAVWLPKFTVEFYSLETGEMIPGSTLSIDPTVSNEIAVPQWNTQTGSLDLEKFPKREGFTLNSIYTDAEGMNPVTTETIVHPGQVDLTNGTASDTTLKLYLKWDEGNWYHIYNAAQFVKNASISGNYVIMDDLDFTDLTWPSNWTTGKFKGTIQGNGYTFRNIYIEQNDANRESFGLFGELTADASLTDVTFENVTCTVMEGIRKPGTNIGLLAGSISSDAVVENVSIVNSTLQIDSDCRFATDDFSLGLVCGFGYRETIDYNGIKCEVTGENPGKYVVTPNGNELSLKEADVPAADDNTQE